jgi:hypothetical protein
MFLGDYDLLVLQISKYSFSRVVCVLHVSTTSQYADIFTKGLSSSVFTEFHSSLNVLQPG